MVIFGGLEVLAAGYILHEHSKSKQREKQRVEEEEEAARRRAAVQQQQLLQQRRRRHSDELLRLQHHRQARQDVRRHKRRSDRPSSRQRVDPPTSAHMHLAPPIINGPGRACSVPPPGHTRYPPSPLPPLPPRQTHQHSMLRPVQPQVQPHVAPPNQSQGQQHSQHHHHQKTPQSQTQSSSPNQSHRQSHRHHRTSPQRLNGPLPNLPTEGTHHNYNHHQSPSHSSSLSHNQAPYQDLYLQQDQYPPPSSLSTSSSTSLSNTELALSQNFVPSSTYMGPDYSGQLHQDHSMIDGPWEMVGEGTPEQFQSFQPQRSSRPRVHFEDELRLEEGRRTPPPPYSVE